jgi:transposase
MHHVGIDLHKRECQICVIDDAGDVVREKRIKTTREALSELFARLEKSKAIVEASSESEWVARHLESLGVEVVVADPSYEAMYLHRHRRVKTDRRDARTLAEALRLGIFRRAHRKSDEQRHVAAQLAVRDSLVRSRAKFVVLAQAILRGAGLRVPSGSTERFLKRLEGIDLPDHVRDELAPLIAVLPTLNAQIAAADAMLDSLARRDKRLGRLMSVPGVGSITAAAFLSVVDDAARFRNARQLAAYAGLVPREYSSGEKSKKGSITKAGQGQLRSLLVQAALRIRRMKSDAVMHLRAWCEKIADRRGKKIAVVALARRLATILFAILRDGTLFHVPKAPLDESISSAA